MKTLFEKKQIERVEIGDYYIILAKNGCFQVRQIKTNFLTLESSSNATYKSVRNYAFNIQGLSF